MNSEAMLQSDDQHSLKSIFCRLRSNKSLKLTEVAVDDYARAQLGATIGRDMPRAEWLRRAAARRRSLAPVR